MATTSKGGPQSTPEEARDQSDFNVNRDWRAWTSTKPLNFNCNWNLPHSTPQHHNPTAKMPLIQPQTNNLPYIDAAPSEQAIASANALITQELALESTHELHHSIPDLRPSQFSSLVDNEHAFLAQGKPRESGIDLTRYEALDAPETGSDVSNWRETLQKAYASAEYLRGRETNLALLETYGKNAWLVGNNQLEALLKGL